MGKWRILSQSINGQKLKPSEWIQPKKRPDLSLIRNSKVLNSFQLENPGYFKLASGAASREGSIKTPEVWLPHKNSHHQSSLQDSRPNLK